MTPFDYQRVDLDRLRSGGYRALLNMSTGSGKTAETLFAFKESSADTALVIAPEQTHESAWIPTAHKLDLDIRVIGNSNKQKKSTLFDFEMGARGLYLVTPELFTRADISAWHGDFLAVDEAHKLATPGSKGQKKLSGFPSYTEEPMARRFDAALVLSGTLLRNRFELAWSHARTLWPHLDSRDEVAYSNYWLWMAARMDYTTIVTGFTWENTGIPLSVPYYQVKAQFPEDTRLKKGDGYWLVGKAKTAKKYYGESDPGRWLSEIPLHITHKKREFCCEFHPNGYLTIDEPTVIHKTISLAPAQKRAIRDMESIMMTYLDDNPLVAEIPLTQKQRIRQMTLAVPSVNYVENDEGEEKAEVSFEMDAASPYLEELIDFLTNEVPDENVVVFTDSQKFASVVTHRLNAAGVSAFEFSGKTRKDRMEKASQFGNTYRVVVGVLSAIAEGLDGLQRVSSTEVWLNSGVDNTVNEQAEGRLFRTGQTRQVLRVYYHDDLGISEDKFAEGIERRLKLAQSLRTV